MNRHDDVFFQKDDGAEAALSPVTTTTTTTTTQSTATTSVGAAASGRGSDDDVPPLGRRRPQQTATAAAAVQEDNSSSSQEVWLFRDDERWEVTWPIWHMLPRDERKALANKYGYKTIGDFEEYMSLQRAVGDSSTDQQQQQQRPYDNNLIYYSSDRSEHQLPTMKAAASAAAAVVTDDAKRKHDDDEKGKKVREEDDDDEDNNKKLEEEMESQQIAAADALPTEDLIKIGGQILVLPEDLLHKVFEWLPVDTYATLSLVSPHWKSFTRTEVVYKRLCERLYLQQSKRKALHVSNFHNSYRCMLEKRPRVRACGGVYVMKYSRIKKIQRDMWTEIPVGAVLESTYYRYLYFQEDGRVLYALTTSPPHEMFRRFVKVCVSREEDPAAVWGSYTVRKCTVFVTAKQSWQFVRLHLTIDPTNSQHGRFGYLSFDRHMTSPNSTALEEDVVNDWNPDRIDYQVPGEPFRFVRDKRL